MAKMPKDLGAQVVVDAPEAPAGAAWLHEMELEGTRALARISGGQVDAPGAPPEIVEALEGLDVASAVVDGVLAEGTYLLFDLLFLDGRDLRKRRLEDRKAALKALLAEHDDPRLRYSDHVLGAGPAFFETACAHGLPGIVSKKRASRWGERGAWLRVPCAAAGDRVAGVQLSNAGRVFYPDDGITKRDVARYYEAVAERVVEEVAGRPLTLVRCDRDIARCAFMRHSKVWGPPALRRVEIQEKTKRGEYLIADDLAGVISLVQMDVLEIHVWNADIAEVEKPNRLVFDIDPGPEVPWPAVIAAAEHVRDALAALDLESFVKTTGGKGLHVVVPLAPSASWDECLTFSRGIAKKLVRAAPQLYTASVPKTGRSAKILVDYLRNGRGNTAVAAYSTRARRGCPIATPLRWDELAAADPRAFTLHTVPSRPDVWKGYGRLRQRLTRTRIAAAA